MKTHVKTFRYTCCYVTIDILHADVTQVKSRRTDIYNLTVMAVCSPLLLDINIQSNENRHDEYET